ncbi:MAG: carboxylating nicotinate-nucleotide diphosphorylase [Gammaproteobacteria bacterium]|jgi:nicotinate-nucleotide pyrophosphorylase (carboxylating)|nr:carboxylating nicotinate-nucleotide diphosphorylase [Gammaproteobacteria bacterium]MBT3859977.1 carboxylating nicotinate-nucleotide diphosphorylase [Gammaproteobacteria bacterium]MBT3986439.1 carboxylating nicotinate-nucleotide diphosphorylase [Gammaproteobacteria bacterium]MBT4255274.1 carboxylating nicotinate-nucleotide diphosphorylase [Gammaproteobacteria bacterium]MBT4580828.1 carboxylating nicotinate-nucleotide diphosphorylase [Gammaproteobacteria bacterium]
MTKSETQKVKLKNTNIPNDIAAVVKFALQEDIGSGDITAELIPIEKQITARIISRDEAIICGIPWVKEVFRQVDESIILDWHVADGDAVNINQLLATAIGPARSIMTAERAALNYLQTLSATASQSKYYSSLVAHTKATLLDTRKTIPGLRTAQKYAVRIGGCQNHRMGLYDAFLIKENHISACGGISEAIAKARELHPQSPVEIEVQDLTELDTAICNEADIVMLDNFSLEDTIKAVEVTKSRCKLEASGGIETDDLVRVAETGVDYISIGALTKHCTAVDLSMLVD